jgi:hypothetical protein
MDAPARRIHPLLLAALALVAVCGYLAGSHRVTASAPSEAPPSSTRVSSNAGLLIEYPLGWRLAGSDPVPGLTLESAVTLTDGSAGGLVSGRLAPGEPGPLPARFVATLSRVPRAEVVNLVSTQAFRYSELALPSFRGTLDLYVVPAEQGGGRVMACFAAQRLTEASQQCEKAVSSVTLTGAATPSLTPDAAYASTLAAIVSGFKAERARARSEMADSDTVAAVAAAAGSLAAHATAASRAVSALEAPQVAAAADRALASALRATASAYSALDEAAATESVGAYDEDRSGIATAESALDRALETFTLLGYGRG